jgi:hypothetical protein
MLHPNWAFGLNSVIFKMTAILKIETALEKD